MWNLQDLARKDWFEIGVRSDRRWGSLAAFRRSYLPLSSSNNPHLWPSLQATSCSETRLSELHTYAIWTLTRSVLCRRTECILAWKICRDFSLFFRGRAWSAKPRGTLAQQTAARSQWRHSACWEVTVKVSALFSVRLNMDVNTENP